MELVILMIVIAVIKSVMDSNKAKAQRQARGDLPEATSDPQPMMSADSDPDVDVLGELGGMVKKFSAKVQQMAQDAVPKSEQDLAEQAAQAKIRKKLKAQQKRALMVDDEVLPTHHEQLKASVKPLKTTVKPIKGAFEEAQTGENRITLNPNIHYHRRAEETQAAIIKVQQGKEAVIQGVIWSEILAKPRALRRR